MTSKSHYRTIPPPVKIINVTIAPTQSDIGFSPKDCFSPKNEPQDFHLAVHSYSLFTGLCSPITPTFPITNLINNPARQKATAAIPCARTANNGGV